VRARAVAPPTPPLPPAAAPANPSRPLTPPTHQKHPPPPPPNPTQPEPEPTTQNKPKQPDENNAESKGRFDELVESKGVRVLIDPAALMHLLGTTMDWQEDRLRSEFVFSNPNSKGSCGCGESFTT
jgi:hypothetical protein